MLVDRPQFLPGQMSHIYTWAGQRPVIGCYVRAEPTATVDWFVKGIKLASNDTFRVISTGSNSSLEVSEATCCRLSEHFECE